MRSHAIAMISSSGEPHHVEIVFLDDGRVSINCSCTGSQMGMVCKHRDAIIRGDDSLVVDEHKRAYFEIHQAFGGSALKGRYEQYAATLAQFEVDKKEIAAKVTFAKKQFAKMLRDGI